MADLMDPQVIDSLIWLGVGQFPDIETIKKAGQIILVDADENTVKELENQLVPVIKALNDQRDIQIEQHYLDIESKDSEFYQYNVTEYSALSKVDGLKVLFPGIRLTQTLTVSTTAITDFVRGLALGSQKNNVLCLDIIDQALPMLKALANDGQLALFSGIQMQSSLTSLYQNAATASEIVNFLASQGYELKTEDSSDPDLPKLGFTINPLWKPLQQTKTQLEQVKQQQDRVKAEQAKVLSEKDSKLSEQAKQLELAKAEHAKVIAEKNAKLEEQAKALAEKDRKLEEVIRAAADATQLLEAMKAENAEQTKALAAEKLKAEQIQSELIKQTSTAQQAKKGVDQSKQETNAVQQALEAAQLETATAKRATAALQQQLADINMASNEMQADFKSQLSSMDAERQKALQQRNDADQQCLSASKNITNLENELETAKRYVKEYEILLKKFEQQNQDLKNTQKRQQLLDAELIRAEVQISIIKELLIKN